MLYLLSWQAKRNAKHDVNHIACPPVVFSHLCVHKSCQELSVADVKPAGEMTLWVWSAIPPPPQGRGFSGRKNEGQIYTLVLRWKHVELLRRSLVLGCNSCGVKVPEDHHHCRRFDAKNFTSILIYFSKAQCYIICLSIGEAFQSCSLVIDLLRAQENPESVLGVTQDTGSRRKTPPNKRVTRSFEFLFRWRTQVTYLVTWRLLSSMGSYLAPARVEQCIVGPGVVRLSIN